jgi:phosphatidylinositol alpha-1,6-mannosyltransferase
MRVLIASEARFERSPDGIVYARGPENYGFWTRYLGVFDQVSVLARLRPASLARPPARRADGPGVVFVALPDYRGPWQYLARLPELRRRAREAVATHAGAGGAFLLRVPGAVAYLAAREIRRRRRPYAVEVLGDPWESLRAAPGSWALAAPLARRWSRQRLAGLCQEAALACYVTASYLAARYPAGGTAFACSDVRLREVASEAALAQRFRRLEAAAAGRRPWRLGFLGSLDRLYKAPEVHLEAVARSLARGWNLDFTIAGDGRHRPELERRAARLGLGDRVRFLGALSPGGAVDDYLDGLDLFLLASRTEGLPRVLVEAMARGCPAIGSTTGGIPELLEPEALVEPGSAAALSGRVETFLAAPGRLRAAAERNHRTAHRYLEEALAPVRKEFLWQLRDSST